MRTSALAMVVYLFACLGCTPSLVARSPEGVEIVALVMEPVEKPAIETSATSAWSGVTDIAKIGIPVWGVVEEPMLGLLGLAGLATGRDAVAELGRTARNGQVRYLHAWVPKGQQADIDLTEGGRLHAVVTDAQEDD